jgi:hypothetical protein
MRFHGSSKRQPGGMFLSLMLLSTSQTRIIAGIMSYQFHICKCNAWKLLYGDSLLLMVFVSTKYCSFFYPEAQLCYFFFFFLFSFFFLLTWVFWQLAHTSTNFTGPEVNDHVSR